jgi:hypothetical protein
MSGFQRLQNIFPKKRSKDYFDLSLSKHFDMISFLLIKKLFQPAKGLACFEDRP